ncbi:MAG: polyphosphate kinase 2 family protein [Oscillospiraceae bacterium]|nr:polyphosphate kinase 2 family protein [Oscillospiraceae bacterium]
MSLKEYTFDGSRKLDLEKLPTNSKKDDVDKEKIIRKTEENLAKMQELQDRLYADGREGVIIVLQAMDAAGKDSTIKHVMGGFNPQGVEVHSFKQPSADELAHDFLWRLNKCIPRRGYIAIFNRSYYEDVLVVQVHEMNKGYHIAERVIGQPTEQFFQKRYRHIRNYEEYLYENGYRIVKIFLNVSKEKQKERFLERLDTPAKIWKFSGSDLKERALWGEYQKAYEKTINETATEVNPWYVLPADQKWYTRYLVSEAIVRTLEDIDPQYPEMPAEEKAKLGEYREALIKD